MNNIIEELEKLNIGKIDKDILLSKLTTYKVGGKAYAVIYPKDVDSLIILLKKLKTNNIKYMILGNGSNVLFSDNDYNGIIIKLNELNNIEYLSSNKIKVGAGYSLIKLSLLAAKKGLTGLEFASGIPGTIGGAVYMNAGAYKSDMGYVAQQVKVLTPDFKIITLENKELDFHYRSSFFQKHKDYICLEVIIKLQKGERDAIESVIKERRERRILSQPLEYPSAGSVFRNPEGDYAGRLIEELGYKGKTKGGAKVSDKHANFVINYDHATGKDIHDLILEIHDKVKKEYNIDMKIEQEFINWE